MGNRASEIENYQTSKTFDINDLIKRYVKPAVGCTEPVAIALAVSIAYHAASGKIPAFIPKDRQLDTRIIEDLPDIDSIEKIKLVLDTNVLKNALYVNIPGTDMHHGIDLAAILGLFSSPNNELALFESINMAPTDLLKIIKQKNLKEKVDVKKRELSGIYIQAYITFKNGTHTDVLIRGSHSNVISIKYNDINLIQESDFSESADINLTELKELTVADMIYKVENELSEDSKKLISEGIEMNMEVSKLGLEMKHGDGIGYAHLQMGTLQDTIEGKIFTAVAAATDVRMEGFNIPVMSSIGSGNQGLIISVSITVLAKALLKKDLVEFTKKEKQILINAVALAHEITAYTTSYTGMLSNLCGCICKAGVGSAAGIGYFLYHYGKTGNPAKLSKDKVVLNSMKNMISSSCGVLCDGAKGSCANKAKSAGFNAYTSALEAMMNTVGTGGIPGNEVTDIKTIMKNFVETYIEKFGQPTDLHIVNYLLTSNC
jgi:L-cysteine desulfidase